MLVVHHVRVVAHRRDAGRAPQWVLAGAAKAALPDRRGVNGGLPAGTWPAVQEVQARAAVGEAEAARLRGGSVLQFQGFG